MWLLLTQVASLAAAGSVLLTLALVVAADAVGPVVVIVVPGHGLHVADVAGMALATAWALVALVARRRRLGAAA